MNNNLFKMFIKTVEKDSNLKILGIKNDTIWNLINRNNLLNKINQCNYILKHENIQKGDRIAYKGKNSIDWVAWNMSCYSQGGIWVPLYSDQNMEYCQHVINDCQPKIIISDDDININNLPNIKSDMLNDEISTELNQINFPIINNDLATIIYTSGTTGNPKGVMLSHENIISNIDFIHNRFNDVGRTTSLNILPWAHIYSLTCELYYNLMFDNCTLISSGKDIFISECKEVKPEVIYIVPKILELVKKKLDFLDKPIIRIILPILLNRIFGNNLINIFTGGAKLDHETKMFFLDNDINICEGYGCSETSPIVSVNHITKPRNIDSLGKILENVSVKIIDGEICVSGPNVMQGYWNNESATKNSMINYDNKKWYKTGDSGEIKNSYLYYHSRISDNYKLNNGKFVNVDKIENIIKKYLKSNFIIFGENSSHNSIISDKEIDYKLLKLINNNLESYLHIKDTFIITEQVMSKFLTPKMSIKRKLLIKYIQETCK